MLVHQRDIKQNSPCVIVACRGCCAGRGIDCDGTRWVRDLGRVGRAHHRRTRGLEEHVGCLSTRESEAEVANAGGCVVCVKQRRRSGR